MSWRNQGEGNGNLLVERLTGRDVHEAVRRLLDNRRPTVAARVLGKHLKCLKRGAGSAVPTDLIDEVLRSCLQDRRPFHNGEVEALRTVASFVCDRKLVARRRRKSLARIARQNGHHSIVHFLDGRVAPKPADRRIAAA